MMRRHFLERVALAGSLGISAQTVFSCTGRASVADDIVLSADDRRIMETLRSFIPPRVFDAHVHLYDTAYLSASGGNSVASERFGAVTGMDAYESCQKSLYPAVEQLRINLIPMPDASMAIRSTGNRKKSSDFLVSHLEKYPQDIGEVFVLPDDTAADIKKLLVHPNIRGFKCYHTCARRQPTWQADIGEYLPESAWQVADENGLCITLHLVKDHALSDAKNFEYICRMAARYPSARLILAHAARGFAAWTVLDAVAPLAAIPNIYFDVSSICEPAPIFAVLKAAGTKRVLWGSDFPISMMRGKCISIADGFLWLYRDQLQFMDSNTEFSATLIGVENLSALRQACQMLDVDSVGVQDIFYNNAMQLFRMV